MQDNARTATILIGIILFASVAYMSFEFIGALSLGVFIYYATRPSYELMVNKGMNKTLSALVAPLIFIIPAILLIAYTIRILTIEIRILAIEFGDSFFDFFDEEFINDILSNSSFPFIVDFPDELQNIDFNDFNDLIESIDTDLIDSLIDLLVELGLSFFTVLSGFFFTIFIALSLAFYLLRDGHKLKSIVHDLLDYDRNVIKFTDKLDKDLEVVFFGNILLAIVTGVLAAITFTLLSVIVPNGEILTYPALIGILCGVTSLIPVIGMKLVYWPVTLGLLIISLIQYPIPSALIFPSIFFIVGLIVVDTIPDLLARPYFGSRGGISTGLLLFSYILGPLTLGWYGLFIGPLLFVALYEFVIILLPTVLKEYNRNG